MLPLKLEYHKAGVAGVEAGLASKFEPEAESGVKATTVAPFQRANDVRHGELHGPPDWERGLKVGGNLENAMYDFVLLHTFRPFATTHLQG